MSSTYSSVKAGPITKKDVRRAVKLLKNNNSTRKPEIIKVSFNKVPDDIEKLKHSRSFGVGSLFGIPVFEDKTIPERECHLEDNFGRIIKLKI